MSGARSARRRLARLERRTAFTQAEFAAALARHRATGELPPNPRLAGIIATLVTIIDAASDPFAKVRPADRARPGGG